MKLPSKPPMPKDNTLKTQERTGRALAYRLRYLTEQMTELAHEIGASNANEADAVCSELLVMRDNVWFMAQRVLPPNAPHERTPDK